MNVYSSIRFATTKSTHKLNPIKTNGKQFPATKDAAIPPNTKHGNIQIHVPDGDMPCLLSVLFREPLVPGRRDRRWAPAALPFPVPNHFLA